MRVTLAVFAGGAVVTGAATHQSTIVSASGVSNPDGGQPYNY
jgi:hypothetical protein